MDKTDIMGSTHHIFLLKMLNKFQNAPQKSSHIVQETLLPWLRNNHSRSLTHHSHPAMSTKDPTKKKKSNTITRLFRSRKTSAISNEPSAFSNLEFVRVLLGWWKVLMDSVQSKNYAKRTIYFDSIVEILSREELLCYDRYLGSYRTCETNSADYGLMAEYERLLNITLAYVIDSANMATICPAISIFCAHVLAISFFKVPQLASCLLQSLPFVRPQTISKISRELSCSSILSQVQLQLLQGMPNHLHSLMAVHAMDKRTAENSRPFEFGEHFLSRWRTSDRAFFILFYQRYHIHLQTYIQAAIPNVQSLPLATKNAILSLSPGYIHLAAYMADSVVALIKPKPVLFGEKSGISHFGVGEGGTMATAAVVTGNTTAMPCNSDSNPKLVDQQNRTPSPVPGYTTIRMSNSFVSNESYSSRSSAERPKPPQAAKFQIANAGLSQNGKPQALEAATRRYAYCLVSCALTPCDDRKIGAATPACLLYQDMVNIWIRVVARRISCSTPISIFCLIDFFENLIDEVANAPATIRSLHSVSSLLDNSFILNVIRIPLIHTDNAIVHQRILAFIYSNFESLTRQRPEFLKMLCCHILLPPFIFERFLTHWHEGVRVLYIKLIYGRLRPLWAQASVLWNCKAPLPATKDKECEGRTCRNIWRDDHQDRHTINGQCATSYTNGRRTDDSDYSRCTLEIHIILEALLTAFYRQHARLQSILLPITDARERQVVMANLSSKDYSLPLPSPMGVTSHGHGCEFSILSPSPAPIYSKKTNMVSLPAHFAVSPPSNKKEDEQRFGFKYSSAFIRAFSFRTSARNQKRHVDFVAQTHCRRPFQRQDHHGYPTPRPYCSYEVSEMQNRTAYASRERLHGPLTSSHSCVIEQSDMSTASEEEADSAYASGTTTPILMDTTSPSWAPEALPAAEAWRYPVSAYLYAGCAADEMDQVATLTRLPSKISIDWPRAWIG